MKGHSEPNRPALRKAVGFAIIAALVLLALMGRRFDTSPKTKRVAGQAFSTIYEAKVVASRFPEDADRELRRHIEKEISRVNEAMSRYHKKSEVFAFNRHKSKKPFSVSKETASLLSKAVDVSSLTRGAFDVTVGPLTRLWGFDDILRRTTEPSPEEIENARLKVGYELLEVRLGQSTVQKKDPDLDIDLSAIAKGYAVDRIALALERLGYADYLVEIGGEIKVRGKNNRGTRWRVAIEKPVVERRETFQVIELKDKAVATSGDYRNFYDLGGRRISHTIDPRTGRPVDHQLVSVTVVHDECAIADALATGLIVLGPDEGFSLAEKEGLAVLFISREIDGSLKDRATPAFVKLRARRFVRGQGDKEKAEEAR